MSVVGVPVIRAAADRSRRAVENARHFERLIRIRRVAGDGAVETGVADVEQRSIGERRRVRDARRRCCLRAGPRGGRRGVEGVATVSR